MACKQSRFSSVGVRQAGACLCTAWVFFNRLMDYNILFVLNLMSWEKVLLESYGNLPRYVQVVSSLTVVSP